MAITRGKGPSLFTRGIIVRKTHEQFVYDMSLERPDIVVLGGYTTNKTKIEFICSCGSVFKASPSHVLNDGTSCKNCGNKRASLKNTMTHEAFVDKVKQLRPHITVTTKYSCARKPVGIVCDKGHRNTVSPGTLLRKTNSSGCKNCNTENSMTPLSEINGILEKKGILPISEYTGKHGRYMLTCCCGHSWNGNLISTILLDRGCPSCAKNGFDDTKPAILYYIKFSALGKTYYKIGITNRSLRERFPKHLYESMTLLHEDTFDVGYFARISEKQILSAFKEFICKDKTIPSGYTEVFVTDVLNLDNCEDDNVI